MTFFSLRVSIICLIVSRSTGPANGHALEPPSTVSAPPDDSREGPAKTGDATPDAKPPRPDDKTLVVLHRER